MARILVAGAINADQVIRLEAPLSEGRLRGEDLGTFIGGAGANTGRALALCGHEVTLASAVAAGPAGDGFLAELAAAGLDVGRVARPERPLSAPLILVEPSGDRTIVHRGGVDRRAWSGSVDHAGFAGSWDAIYAAWSAATLRAVVAGHLGRCPVVGQWYGRMDPPVAEVVIAAGDAFGGRPPVLPPQDTQGHPRCLIVTRGAAGARAQCRDGTTLERPAVPARVVVDTTGAGDVYAAGIVHGLVRGWPLAAAMDFGARLAADQVAHMAPGPSQGLAAIAEAAAADIAASLRVTASTRAGRAAR